MADLGRAIAMVLALFSQPATTVNAAAFHSHPDQPARNLLWDDLAVCESAGRWDIDTGNGYFGGVQFHSVSWWAVGGTGLPHHWSRLEQIYRAELLFNIQGAHAWPGCHTLRNKLPHWFRPR